MGLHGKIMQYDTSGRVQYWRWRKFQKYISQIAKMVHPDFLGANGGRTPHQSDSENWYWQVVASGEDTCNQNGKPSTPPFPLSSTYYYYFHSLLTAFANVAPPKHCFINTVPKESVPNYVSPIGFDHAIQRWRLGTLPIRFSTGCLLKILLIFINLPLITSSSTNSLVQSCSHSPKSYARDIL